MTSLIKLENIHYTYPNGTKALQGVNLNISQGEKMVLMGANGAGKTSLFLTLNGLYIPYEGKYYINEQPVTWNKQHRNQLRQSVGIVFQEPEQQLFAPTVYEEISFGLVNMGFSRDKATKRIEDVMALMQIAHLRDMAPHLLSYGQKKQVAMASIIAMDPEVLVLDEPLAGLDPVHVQQTIQLMDMLHKHGKTLIVSTHDVNFAWSWANRIALMNEGQIVDCGFPQQVFSNESNIQQCSLEMPMMIRFWTMLFPDENIQHCPRTEQDLKEKISSDQLMSI